MSDLKKNETVLIHGATGGGIKKIKIRKVTRKTKKTRRKVEKLKNERANWTKECM